MHEKRGKHTGRHMRPRRWRLALLWLAMLGLLASAAAVVVVAAYWAGAGSG
jgi:hypothetical protein